MPKQVKKIKKVRMTVSLPEETVNIIDRLAEKTGLSRASVASFLISVGARRPIIDIECESK